MSKGTKTILIILIILFCPIIFLAGAAVYFFIPVLLIGIGCYVYFLHIQPGMQNEETSRKYGADNGNLNMRVKILPLSAGFFVFRGTVTPYKNTVSSSRKIYKPEEHTVNKIVCSVGKEYGQIETGEWIRMDNCVRKLNEGTE